MTSRYEVEKFYEEETGLSATRGAARVERLEQFVNSNGLQLSDIAISDDPGKMKRDYNRGIRWSAGQQHGDTVCLGYTSGRGNWHYKNAIFASSPKLETD